MVEVGEILVAASCALVRLEVIESNDADVDVTKRRVHGAGIARLELDAGDCRQQLDPERRSTQANHAVRAEKQLCRQLRNVEAEGSEYRDQLLRRVLAHGNPDVDVRRRARMAVEADGVATDDQVANAMC